MTDAGQHETGRRAGWGSAALVAPVAAAMFTGATAWAVGHRPVTAAASAPVPNPATTPAKASADPTVVALQRAVAKRSTEIATLRRNITALQKATVKAKAEAAAAAARARSSGSSGGGSWSGGSSDSGGGSSYSGGGSSSGGGGGGSSSGGGGGGSSSGGGGGGSSSGGGSVSVPAPAAPPPAQGSTGASGG